VNRRRKSKKKCGRRLARQGGWYLWRAHEMTGLVAFALACGSSPHDLRVRLATPYEDSRESTDLWLLHERAKQRIDLTKGRVGWKIIKNKEHRGENPRSIWAWGVRVNFPTAISIISNTCFQQVWERVASGGWVSLTPADICPEHGESCDLIPQLRFLWGMMVGDLPEGNEKYPKNWKALFR
jgi:hypothetical protein